MSSNSEALRASTLATLNEIAEGEAKLKAAGIDVSDPDEWMQLGDIVARLERKLAAKMKPEAAE
jgi:hypothetical protein